MPQEERHRQRHCVPCQCYCLPPQPWDICLWRCAQDPDSWDLQAVTISFTFACRALNTPACVTVGAQKPLW